MDLGEIVNAAGVLVVGAGLIATWVRNGSHQKQRDIENARAQAQRDQELRQNQQNILKRLDDPDEGLKAINKAAQQMKNHCTAVSTSIASRLEAAERDIKDIKHKP